MKKILIIVITILLTSCNTNHKMYYDLEKQELLSCNNLPFYNLSIDGINDGIHIYWEDSIKTPDAINLNNIPDGYYKTTGGIKRKKPFKLKPNNEYTISKSGLGKMTHMIKIWTDATGNVYKTTNPNCDCDDGVPEEWVK
jgi:hypothetical protein